ncbi:MAG: hypothetical protein LBT74_08270 [Acidobacteriota bacterium]|nr:hypothetical protein [Acidobacteriota bacterium]
MCVGAPHPEPHERCDDCPLGKLDAARESPVGALMGRAAELNAALKLGVRVTLDEIDADEFYAMLVIAEEVAKWEAERMEKQRFTMANATR